MKTLFLIFLFASVNYAEAENLTVYCGAKIVVSSAVEKLTEPSCGFAQNLVKNPDVENYHRNIIYQKLADKLATQIEQNVEETALFAQYATVNNREILSAGESDIKKNCKLDNISQSEKCVGYKNVNEVSKKLKLELIRSKIQKNLNTTCSNQNLQQILQTKVLETIGRSVPAENGCVQKESSCPIAGTTGAFSLSSQLDENSAIEFINRIQNPQTAILAIDEVFNNYPQFKLIKNSGEDFKKDFVNYLKAYKKNQGSAKAFINKFIFENVDSQKALSHTLAGQCRKLNENLEKFICGKDLEGSELASLEKDASVKLFGLNPTLKNDADVFDDAPGDGKNFLAAFGFQCLAKSQIKNGNKLNRENSVDSLFETFTKNTRQQSISDKVLQDNNDQFCSIYNCKENSVKGKGACEKGGPMTSASLRNIYGCDKQICSTDILKYISYLESHEKLPSTKSQTSNERKLSSGNSGSSDKSSAESQPRYSAFLENYLGAKGTLIAEGKQVTPAAIAEKTKEIEERKPAPVALTQSSKPSETKSLQFAKNDTSTAPTATSNAPVAASNSTDYSYKESMPESKNHNNITAIRSPRTASVNRNAEDNTTASSYNSTRSNNRNDEINSLRSELEDLTKSMKGSDAEKLATIADVNSRYSSKNPSVARDLTSAEQERNAQYERNLSAWEERLRRRESDLFAREARGPSNFADSTNSKTQGGEAASRGARSSGSESAILLTASDKDKEKSGGVGAQGKSSGKPNAISVTDSAEAIISSDDLAILKADSLKKLGINTDSAFVMKVHYLQKYYSVPVKQLRYQGKDILVPLLNKSNSALSKIILESPLFADYKTFQESRL